MAGQSKLTLHDLLRLALPVGTMIVAGQQGAHRPITWVHVLNTRPPAFPHLRGRRNGAALAGRAAPAER